MQSYQALVVRVAGKLNLEVMVQVPTGSSVIVSTCCITHDAGAAARKHLEEELEV